MDIDPVDTDLVDADLLDPEGLETAPSRPARHRTLPVIVISALLGALAGGAVVYLGLMKPSATPTAPMLTPRSAVGTPAPTLRGTQASAGSEWSSALSAAKQDIATGRYREAQEEYLSILLIEPTHEEAMRGLVRVAGLMAKGDRAALRRQAEEYRRAIALGIDTEEHYTAPAMELLARASLQAAGVRAAAAEPKPQSTPAPERSRTTPRSGTSRPEPAPQTTPSPPQASRTGANPAPRTPRTQPATPAKPTPTTQPAPSVQPVPPPPAVVDPNEPFVTVVIGPFGSSDRASAITGELTMAGYAARLRRQAPGSYVITLGPYRKSEAERAAGFVRSRFGQSLPVSLTATP